MINNLNSENWIKLYIHWELSLIKELGYDINIFSKESNSLKEKKFITINNKSLKVPNIYLKNDNYNLYKDEVTEALNFNKELLIENFINPNRLRFPLFRNILENYFK